MTYKAREEIAINNLEELLSIVDKKAKKNKKCYYSYKSSIIDYSFLTKKFNLKNCKTELTYGNIISFIKFDFMLTQDENTYIISEPNQYGYVAASLNINNNYVLLKLFANSVNDDGTYKSKSLKNLTNNNFVVIDIETTGLDFLNDDIIQIAIYKNENEKYVRYLPLKKKKTNEAFYINKINDKILENTNALSQNEVNDLITKFDLENIPLVYWSGKNQFDRNFLEIYFSEHNLNGLEKLTFYNGKNLLKKISKKIAISKSKDDIADAYGISTKNSHEAISDCIIEKQIIDNLLNENYTPLLTLDKFNNSEIINKIKELFNLREYHADEIKTIYENFCYYLMAKNGKIYFDYDKPHRTRGKEWIDIHHIDETTIDDIANRTRLAIESKDKITLKELKPYNKANRLVYANKIEHFILHCLIALYNIANGRHTIFGGVHWQFGAILHMQTALLKDSDKLYEIQKHKELLFNQITFDEIIDIYSTILVLERNHSIEERFEFYKLNEYKYDENKFNKIISIIKSNIKNKQ